MTRLLVLALLLQAASGCTPAQDTPPAVARACPAVAHRGMTDVTADLGLPKLGGLCLVFADFDADDLPDLLVAPTNAQGYADLRLYPNHGSGVFGEHVEILPFAKDRMACAAGDYDNDGLLDVLLTSMDHPPRLLHNEGGLSLQEVPYALPKIDGELIPLALAMFDENGDGYLDLFIGRSGPSAIADSTECEVSAGDFFCDSAPANPPPAPLVLRNIPGEGFTPSSTIFGQPWPGLAQAVAVVDWNQDRHPDLLVSNDYGKNALFVSDGMGSYRDTAADEGLAQDNHGMGVALGDFDGDGRLDVYAADLGPDRFQFGSPQGMVDRAAALGIVELTRRTSTWSPLALDLDNDGHLDVFAVTSAVAADDEDMVRVAVGSPVKNKVPQWDFVLYNEGTRFEPEKLVQRKGTAAVAAWGASAAADYDGDGDLDIVAASGVHMQLRVWRNDLEGGSWLAVGLHGSPRTLDGTRVALIRGGAEIAHRTLRLARGGIGTSWQTVHFGLCQLDEIDAIELVYPWGAKQRVDGPIATNQRMTVTVQ